MTPRLLIFLCEYQCQCQSMVEDDSDTREGKGEAKLRGVALRGSVVVVSWGCKRGAGLDRSGGML